MGLFGGPKTEVKRLEGGGLQIKNPYGGITTLSSVETSEIAGIGSKEGGKIAAQRIKNAANALRKRHAAELTENVLEAVKPEE